MAKQTTIKLGDCVILRHQPAVRLTVVEEVKGEFIGVGWFDALHRYQTTAFHVALLVLISEPEAPVPKSAGPVIKIPNEDLETE